MLDLHCENGYFWDIPLKISKSFPNLESDATIPKIKNTR